MGKIHCHRQLVPVIFPREWKLLQSTLSNRTEGWNFCSKHYRQMTMGVYKLCQQRIRVKYCDAISSWYFQTIARSGKLKTLANSTLFVLIHTQNSESPLSCEQALVVGAKTAAEVLQLPAFSLGQRSFLLCFQSGTRQRAWMQLKKKEICYYYRCIVTNQLDLLVPAGIVQ